MAERRRSLFWEMLKPRLVRLWIIGAGAAGFYQFGCDQFGWPKLPVLWSMTPLPWWGWFFVALAGFVYAIFEYVRRHIRAAPPLEAPAQQVFSPTVEQSTEVDARLAKLEHNHANLRDLFTAAQAENVQRATQNEAGILETRRLMRELLRRDLIRDNLERYLETMKREEEMWALVQSNAVNNNPDPKGRNIMEWEIALSHLAAIGSLCVGTGIIRSHPLYDKDNTTPAPGDAGIEDEQRRQSWRRLYEERCNAKKSIDGTLALMRKELNRLDEVVAKFAKESRIGPAK